VFYLRASLRRSDHRDHRDNHHHRRRRRRAKKSRLSLLFPSISQKLPQNVRKTLKIYRSRPVLSVLSTTELFQEVSLVTTSQLDKTLKKKKTEKSPLLRARTSRRHDVFKLRLSRVRPSSSQRGGRVDVDVSALSKFFFFLRVSFSSSSSLGPRKAPRS
jgi:hypothetical protein